MHGDPEVINRKCEEIGEYSTPENYPEVQDELDLDARNVLIELRKMYEKDTSAGDMEVILVDYLKDKGYTLLYPKPDWSSK